MKKVDLLNMIKKYHLNGTCESCIFDCTVDNYATVTVAPEEKNMVAIVTCTLPELPNSKLGIYETSKLLKLISILDDEIKISIDDSVFQLSDGKIESNFILSDLEIIPKPPAIKEIPEMDIEIELTPEFRTNFLKACNALTDNVNFGIVVEDGKINVILNYSLHNVTNIKIPAAGTIHNEIEPIKFYINYLKEILLANSEYETSKFLISGAGLAKIAFTGKDYEAQYYLVKLQD